MFRQLQQKEGETTEQFITRLRQHAVNCNLGDQEDDNIRDQVIDECVDRRLKGKYLEKGTLTVVQLQEIARAHEAAQWQVKNMEQNSGPGLDSGGEPVGAVSGRNPQKTVRVSPPKQPGKQLCFRCGKAGHYAKGPKCPVKGKKCDLCSKQDTFVMFVDLKAQARKTD